MALFTAATIQRYSQEGETDFASEHPCILTRLALSVTTGNPLITLPDDVINIRRVTYKGFKLDPLPHRQMREAFQSANQVSKPFWYVYNNIGQNLLKLFPTPSENITASQLNLWGSAISTQLVVEYFRAPDFSTFTIPAYFRRRLLKSYVLLGCFNIEGAGQNLKNTKYFTSKYSNLKTLYSQLMHDIYSKPRKLCLGNGFNNSSFPGQPILPIDRFGTSVDTGY